MKERSYDIEYNKNVIFPWMTEAWNKEIGKFKDLEDETGEREWTGGVTHWFYSSPTPSVELVVPMNACEYPERMGVKHWAYLGMTLDGTIL